MEGYNWPYKIHDTECHSGGLENLYLRNDFTLFLLSIFKNMTALTPQINAKSILVA